jgi:hypothetical protein
MEPAIPSESPDMAAKSSWRHLRQLRALQCAASFGTMFVFVAVGVPLAQLAGVPLLVIPALWLVACIALTLYLGDFRCPRCGKTFYRGRWYFASQCVHCGLPTGANPAGTAHS